MPHATNYITDEEEKAKKKAYNAEWRLANKEHLRKYDADSYLKNRDRRAAYLEKSRAHRAVWGATYRAANKAACKARAAAYRGANKARIAANNAEYRRINRERRAAYGAKYYAEHRDIFRNQDRVRRSRERGVVIGDVKTIARWERTWKSKKAVKCYWCGNRFAPKKCHADHVIPISKGGEHAVGNLCISCEQCNWTKNAKTLDAWNKKITNPVLF